MIGDRVMIGMGSINVSSEMVMAYDLRKNPDGTSMLDFKGAVTLTRVGGIKGGSTGVIIDHPQKVAKSQLQSHDATSSIGGDDYISIYRVMVDQYQKEAWLPQDHIHVISGKVT